jgi:hypothetical protein
MRHRDAKGDLGAQPPEITGVRGCNPQEKTVSVSVAATTLGVVAPKTNEAVLQES